MSARIVALVDDRAERPGLEAEHGLSFYIEADGAPVLLDTGRSGGVLARNAAALGVDLGHVGAIVLSHGHYDHTGGLADALRLAPNARVFA
ncbi:MAG TPA: MBL fold metallo-hydrolase, partial [Candidatus Brocadiia bacterium]|nr:MBL fold metallo-hydrolase [Candidatus Brocadiia bacterium]